MGCEQCSIDWAYVPQSLITLDELHDTIKRRNMPFSTSLYSLLGNSELEGKQTFADIVLEAKNEFETYNPRVVRYLIDINGIDYTFKDNFKDYVNNKIPESDIRIKPRTIITCSMNTTLFPTNQTWTNYRYDYVSGRFYSIMAGSNLVKAYIDYPFHVAISQDGNYDARSGIYLIADRDQIVNVCALRVIERCRDFSQLIQMPGFTAVTNYDTIIARLEQAVLEDRQRSSMMYEKWNLQ